MPPSVSDVENHDSTSWNALDQSKKQYLLDFAIDEVDDLYGGRVATLNEIEGDIDQLYELVACHHWQLAEGGQAQSESATGGSINFNIPNEDIPPGWADTRWGRQAVKHLRGGQSIGMVTTH